MGTYDTRGGTPASPDMNDPFDAIEMIIAEIDRQKNLPNAATIASIEGENSRNDRIAVALAYLGRAAEKVQRNERENCHPAENLVKAAAVIVAAIEAEYRAVRAAEDGPA